MKKKKPQPEIVTVKGASVNIYFTPTTKGGKEYPGYTLVYTEGGKRIRRSIADLDKARTSAKSIAGQLSSGTGHAHALTPAELSDYTGAVRILRQAPGIHLTTACSTFAQAWATFPDTADILAAIRHYREHLDKQNVATISVTDLFADLIKSREKTGCAPRYIQKLKHLSVRITAAFRCNIGSITTADLQQFLDRLDLSPASRKNFRIGLTTLFAHAKKRGFLPRDRQTEAEHLDAIKIPSSPVLIYSPGDLAKALDHAKGEAQLAVALGAFTGIRAAELHQLEWKDIGAEYITVAADKAKTAQRRLVPILPALAAFLLLHKRGKGRIFPTPDPSEFSTMICDAFRNAGVPAVHNGLRHSFCTYRLADIQSADQVALEAGNSPNMLFKHYREIATREAGAAWFAVRPAGKGKKVLQFSAAA